MVRFREHVAMERKTSYLGVGGYLVGFVDGAARRRPTPGAQWFDEPVTALYLLDYERGYRDALVALLPLGRRILLGIHHHLKRGSVAFLAFLEAFIIRSRVKEPVNDREVRRLAADYLAYLPLEQTDRFADVEQGVLERLDRLTPSAGRVEPGQQVLSEVVGNHSHADAPICGDLEDIDVPDFVKRGA